MRFVYLEAGSGAINPIPPMMVGAVSKHLDIPIIVGGGIRTPEAAHTAKKAGASAIVTGTLVEEESQVRERIREIVKAISN
jgi:phosphoglycerol geranylgeranyltransferase